KVWRRNTPRKAWRRARLIRRLMRRLAYSREPAGYHPRTMAVAPNVANDTVAPPAAPAPPKPEVDLAAAGLLPPIPTALPGGYAPAPLRRPGSLAPGGLPDLSGRGRRGGDPAALQALADGLAVANRGYGHPRADELAARFADPGVRVVVTGQQPGLLGGPLY